MLYNARQSVCAVPGGGKQISINSSKGGQSYRDWHHPGKHSQQFLPKCLKKHKKRLSRWPTCWLNELFINSSVPSINALIDWFTERLNSLFNSLPAYHYKTMVIYARRYEIEFFKVYFQCFSGVNSRSRKNSLDPWYVIEMQWLVITTDEKTTTFSCSLTTRGSTAGGSTCLIWQTFLLDAIPDAIPKGINVSGWNQTSNLLLAKLK